MKRYLITFRVDVQAENDVQAIDLAEQQMQLSSDGYETDVEEFEVEQGIPRGGPMKSEMFDHFVRSYIGTALWCTTDNDGVALDDSKYNETEWAPEAMERIEKDCAAFIEKCTPILDPFTWEYPVAHDFWLTRNRHGAGFWDGDYPEAIGKALTELSHGFGEVDIYVGDDGKFHVA